MLRIVRLGAPALAVAVLTACGAESTPVPVTTQGGGDLASPTETIRPRLAATQTADNLVCVGIPVYTVQLDTMGLPYPWQPNCVAATPYDASQPPGPSPSSVRRRFWSPSKITVLVRGSRTWTPRLNGNCRKR